MIQTIIIVLVVLRALGYGFNFGGNLVHLLLVLALLAIIFRGL